MPKDKSSKGPRHAGPLEVQLREDMPGQDSLARDAQRRKKRRDESRHDAGSGIGVHDDEGAEPGVAAAPGAGYLSAKISRRVLDEARTQVEDALDPSLTGASTNMKKKKTVAFAAAPMAGASLSRGAISAAVSGRKKGSDHDHDDDDSGDEDDAIVDFEEHDGARAGSQSCPAVSSCLLCTPTRTCCAGSIAT